MLFRSGLVQGALSLIVLLDSARGVWDIRSILHASARIAQAGLDEVALAAKLGIVSQDELDPFVYARGRLAEALRALDRVAIDSELRPEADQLRVEIQRLLLAADAGQASPSGRLH